MQALKRSLEIRIMFELQDAAIAGTDTHVADDED